MLVTARSGDDRGIACDDEVGDVAASMSDGKPVFLYKGIGEPLSTFCECLRKPPTFGLETSVH